MEAELNIANILKDKPSGTKLYADAFGELSLEHININRDNSIYVKTKTFNCCSFYSDGKYTKEGEPILVPSKKMRDWSKFAWKKGDVLVSRDKNMHLIFEKFTDDTYTIFAGKHCYEKDFRNEYNYERRFDSFMTEYFTLETDDTDVQTYIRIIENKLGGKLNLKTLEIEKTQLEFKDRKIKYQFKPFEKVLVRNNHNEHWRAAFFGYINENKRYETTSISWKYCIPYKGNESLLGTTKNLEE